MDRDTFRSLLGEGFHTAFRNAVDTATAVQIHRLISGMDPDDWAAVLDFVADGMPADVFTDEAAESMPTGEEFLAEFTRPELMGPASPRFSLGPGGRLVDHREQRP